MIIRAVRHETFALGGDMSNSAISFTDMTASALVVDLECASGVVHGLGFDSYGRYAHAGLLQERFIARLWAAGPDLIGDKRGHAAASAVRDVLMRDEKGGGHGERAGAVGLLETALWDALAKAEDLPLWALLQREYGHAGDDGAAPGNTAIYASGGHYRTTSSGAGSTAKSGQALDDGSTNADTAALRDEAVHALDAGYGWFKLKIAGAPPAADDRRLRAVTDAIGDPALVALDANCALGGDAALERIAALATAGYRWIEEPVDPLDYAGLARVVAHASAPIATGENVFSNADAANLLRYGGLRPRRDVLQVDIGLAYGITEFMAIIRTAEACGWHRRDFMPHAGHQLALHVAAGLGLGAHETSSQPGGAFSGVSDDTRIENGIARLSDAPGAGIEFKPALLRYFDTLI